MCLRIIPNEPVAQQIGRFSWNGTHYDSPSCTECCADCSGSCGDDCPLEIYENACDFCIFKGGAYKKPSHWD